MKVSHVSVSFLALLLAGCAAPTANLQPVDTAAVKQEEAEQRRLLFDQYRRDEERVYRLTAPLFRAAADLCSADKVGPAWGLFSISSLALWEKTDRAALVAAYGLTDHFTFTYLDPQGPLIKAGVQVGDQLMSVNGKTHPSTQRGLEQAAADYLKLTNTPAQVKIARAGIEHTMTVVPERLPRMWVNYDPFSTDVNAFADGTSLNVMRGLLRAISSDEALAMVLAHEIAHNCEEHIEAKKTNIFLGGLADAVIAGALGVASNDFAKIGANAYSQDFEREADYVGLYYMARAQGNLQEAMTMYRVLTSESGGGLTAAYGASHPSNPERFVRMQAAAKEIEAKRAAGQALMPDRVKK